MKNGKPLKRARYLKKIRLSLNLREQIMVNFISLASNETLTFKDNARAAG